uniref:Uncharacterized protein n=1 Tax=Ananas comosus var. bracteatus TaxID=296719 RepID=A0A6V7PPA3_ANACO|nr:unnamed protein product [Ananas comosus var. bracteatus]
MGKKHDRDDGRITPRFEVQSKKRDDPRKKNVVKHVAWADEVGRALVESKSIYAEDAVTILGFGKSLKDVQRIGVNAPSQQGRRLLSGSLARRCFRCLASNNRIAQCRDPVRCLSYRELGHQASTCKSKVLRASDKMNKAYRQQGRTQPAKVYVLYTEEYSCKRELRRNAVLTDVIQPADLGPNSTGTIASALARW